jgi:hypothetical protein
MVIKLETMNIKELVKDKIVRFDSFRQGYFYYNIISSANSPQKEAYQFTVPLDDIGTATLLAKDKAITYMRWIRKAVNNGTLMPVKS